MDIDDARIREAVGRTEIVRAPKQNLFTFGMTSIHYYLVTEPAYLAFTPGPSETVVREGQVIAERPRIVTPQYLTSLQGFSENARRYFDQQISKYGRNSPGLLYAYRNEHKEMNIVSNSLAAVIEQISADLDRRNDPLTALIKGIDELWDVALIRFIYEMTSRSLGGNISDLGTRGLLGVDRQGVPVEARYRIEQLFRQAARGEAVTGELKAELDRWDLFEEYEDRFYNLFRK